MRAILDEPLTIPFQKKAESLAREYDLHTNRDLLRHYPRRYLEFNELTALGRLPLDEHVTVIAEVAAASFRMMRPRPGKRPGEMMNVVVTDGQGGRLHLTFFARVAYHKTTLRPGVRALFSGKVSDFRGQRQLAQPQYDLLIADDGAAEDALRHERSRPIPIYPATAEVSSQAIQRHVQALLETLRTTGQMPGDPLPAALRAEHSFMDLAQALAGVHRPQTPADWKRARERLRFEEAFILQVALARRRHADRELPATPRAAVPGGLVDALDERLPFELTTGQREVGDQIARDLVRPYPMQRLLQGEVGSGKTVVALRAMLAVIDAGGQAALLAPTEVLAAQHCRSIRQLLGPLAEGGMLGGDGRGTQVTLLTGSLATAPRRKALLQAASGEAGIVVGTHALLSDRVQFADLGLIVVDEQHRFGVEQRDALRGKGQTTPHLLVMTATPIPRTVAMTVFGDLETSTLTELPAGRSPIATSVVVTGNQRWVDRAWQRVREEAQAGHQVFVVCPRIGDDEKTAAADDWDEDVLDDDLGDEPEPEDGTKRPPGHAVLDVVTGLRELPVLQGLRIEPLHGRMSTQEREENMRAFAAGEIDVLVATTVIEVGVDVPNASTMVVMDADRFGVSQLHQLRGRVGRGSVPGLCLLFTAIPAGPTKVRLDAIAATLDGFELARVDLDTRREGDVLGNRQSGGKSSLRLLRVVQDEDLILQARQEATAVVESDPGLTGQPALAIALDSWLQAEQEVYLERG